jgi:hypothetical protein
MILKKKKVPKNFTLAVFAPEEPESFTTFATGK